jgi:hypothetical protein
MLGKIALEEAYEVAGNDEKSMREAKLYIHPSDRERYVRQIHDINDERVRLADDHGIGYTIVSLTVPGIQGITDRVQAEKRATEISTIGRQNKSRNIHGSSELLRVYPCTIPRKLLKNSVDALRSLDSMVHCCVTSSMQVIMARPTSSTIKPSTMRFGTCASNSTFPCTSTHQRRLM